MDTDTRTFAQFQTLLTPTPVSPCLPEEQSDYTSTPDCNLIVQQRGLMMTFAVMFRAIDHDTTIKSYFPPAMVQALVQFSPIFREMAKHDDPSQAFYDGGLTSWWRSSWISWQLWWNQSSMFKQVFAFTRQQWDAIYLHATEDEKAWIFCIKHVSKRPSMSVSASVPSNGQPDLPE